MPVSLAWRVKYSTSNEKSNSNVTCHLYQFYVLFYGWNDFWLWPETILERFFLNSRHEALIRPLLFTQKQHPSHHNSWQFSREAAGGNREVFCGCSLLGRRGPWQSGNVCTALAWWTLQTGQVVKKQTKKNKTKANAPWMSPCSSIYVQWSRLEWLASSVFSSIAGWMSSPM